jgi:integrase
LRPTRSDKLGLRATEVTTLTLNDIDWRSGETLVADLRHGRPPSSCRRLFLRTLAPHVGFASGCAITMITKTALERAGIRGYAHQGAHIFRHSLVTELLQSGATLSEIGRLLRHESQDTTRIAAKKLTMSSPCIQETPPTRWRKYGPCVNACLAFYYILGK